MFFIRLICCLSYQIPKAFVKLILRISLKFIQFFQLLSLHNHPFPSKKYEKKGVITQMGRARKQKARDKNKNSLPQTPRKDIATDDQDLELAKELNLYDLKGKLGFPATEVKRK